MPRVATFEDLGTLGYAEAYAHQQKVLDEVLGAREAGEPCTGRVLYLEHSPVITVSNRPAAAAHLLATPDMLHSAGVEVARTDRGGDITYHGPGQLVVYPILDLNALNLGLHAYMRMLESIVIGVCGRFGIIADRDASATGVWVRTAADSRPEKIAAMGVRVRRWISMHGLALNVSTNLAHFGLIVPCGLAGRGVTSMQHILGENCPDMHAVKAAMTAEFTTHLCDAAQQATVRRSRANAISP